MKLGKQGKQGKLVKLVKMVKLGKMVKMVKLVKLGKLVKLVKMGKMERLGRLKRLERLEGLEMENNNSSYLYLLKDDRSIFIIFLLIIRTISLVISPIPRNFTLAVAGLKFLKRVFIFPSSIAFFDHDVLFKLNNSIR